MKHIRMLGILILLIGLALSVVGCAVSEKSSENEAMPTPMPGVVVTRMTALYVGPLTMVDGCLRLGDSEAGNLVVWPPDFEVSIENGTIWVLYDDQEVEVRLGQVVRLGGGEVKSIEAFDERTRRRVPSGCPGPYWLVGSISPVEAADLVGTEWVLTSLNGEGLIEDTSITLYFEEAFLGGSMTCNGYGGGPDSGKYVATDDGALTVLRPLAVTVQLCSSPEGIMEQEAAYIEALQSVASYRVVDDRLEIENAAAETTLVFARKEE
jgi:heat shock protein HslJ